MKILLFMMVILAGSYTYSQKTDVRGKVTDASTTTISNRAVMGRTILTSLRIAVLVPYKTLVLVNRKCRQ